MRATTGQFYKGIPGFTRARPEAYAVEAERSVYGWWWRYLRLSPVLWYARTTGLPPKSEPLAKVFAAAGDLSHDSFHRWWTETGAALHVEGVRPHEVRMLDLARPDEIVLYPERESIVVEIPLTIRQGTISRQIRKILAEYHAGRKLDVATHSSAKWPLHTKRYNLDALEKAYWTLLYRLLYPDIAAWRIGDRLRLAPGLNLRGVERGRFIRRTSPLDRMNSTIGRHLYKAKWTLWNAEQGSFPNATKIDLPVKPFGAKRHGDYVEATAIGADKKSPWQEWLRQQYHEELVHRVRVKNNLFGVKSINSRTQELLPKFIAGETDLIA